MELTIATIDEGNTKESAALIFRSTRHQIDESKQGYQSVVSLPQNSSSFFAVEFLILDNLIGGEANFNRAQASKRLKFQG